MKGLTALEREILERSKQPLFCRPPAGDRYHTPEAQAACWELFYRGLVAEGGRLDGWSIPVTTADGELALRLDALARLRAA